jgi:predicted nucleotidyltransferase
MDLHPDFKDLLAAFGRYGVEYALLGGYAVGYHARPRATKDLDLLIAGTESNLRQVAAALADFGAPAVAIAGVQTMKRDEIVHFGVPPVRVDLLQAADGIDADVALSRAERALLDGLTIPVLAIEDLIANKRAAGRPQDLADVSVLEQVLERRAP